MLVGGGHGRKRFNSSRNSKSILYYILNALNRKNIPKGSQEDIRNSNFVDFIFEYVYVWNCDKPSKFCDELLV